MVHRTRETVRAALAHQTYPFPLLVERLAPVRDPGRSALCDVTFGLTYLIGEGGVSLDWGQLSLTALPVPRRTSQSDLDVQLVESAHGMTAVFQYDTDLYEAETIRRMGRHYIGLLRAVCARPTQQISEPSLLDESERAGLIAGWTPKGHEGAGTARVEALVETQVDRAPALSGSGRALTYRVLTLAEREQIVGEWNRTETPYPLDSVRARADRGAGGSARPTRRRRVRGPDPHLPRARPPRQPARPPPAARGGPGALVGVCLERSPGWSSRCWAS